MNVDDLEHKELLDFALSIIGVKVSPFFPNTETTKFICENLHILAKKDYDIEMNLWNLQKYLSYASVRLECAETRELAKESYEMLFETQLEYLLDH